MPFQVASFARRHYSRHSLPLPGGRIVPSEGTEVEVSAKRIFSELALL